MLEQTQEKEFDPFDQASNPPERTFDLFGKVEITAWACGLVKGQGKVPFDPAQHKSRLTAIDVFIQPLPEIDIKYPKSLEDHWIAEFTEWAKITLPSIKALGVDNVREINGKFARVTKVPNGKQYAAKDVSGNPTGEMKNELTMKFVQFFADEESCRAAYLAAGGAPSNGNGHNVPAAVAPSSDEQGRKTALQFLEIIVKNTALKSDNWEEVKALIAVAVAQYPDVIEKYYTADSPETHDLMTKFNAKLLPF
jgi:hypothetical protein